MHVMINIFNNAKDILLEKKVSPAKIVLKVVQTSNQVTLTVIDNAGGIPHAVLPNVFNPYFTTKGNTHGTGLGLYMTKKIITESFDARIEASNIGQGACFTLCFKRK